MSDSEISWTVACQAPLSIGFDRQDYWSGLPFPSGNLWDPGIEPMSTALVSGIFNTESPWKPLVDSTFKLFPKYDYFSPLLPLPLSLNHSLSSSYYSNLLPGLAAPTLSFVSGRIKFLRYQSIPKSIPCSTLSRGILFHIYKIQIPCTDDWPLLRPSPAHPQFLTLLDSLSSSHQPSG